MVIDPATGHMTFCNAGHNPPFSIHHDGHVRQYDDGGMPVGVFLDQEYAQGEATLDPNATLVLYTDGIVEARNEQDFEFGMDQLIQTVQENPSESAQGLMETIIKKVREEWLATDQEDDWTVMIVKSK
jgi:sigma-B regulation protein RsbU (phosphoserine phosphatase)